MSFLLHATGDAFQIANTLRNLVAVGYRSSLGARIRTVLKVMGIVMKKLALLATALATVSGSAVAADMHVKAYKAPPPVIVSPWDVGFGASITNNYVFRGISQSNRNGSIAAYFEPRYNVNPNLQLYAGVGGSSISFTNRASAEINVYGGIRPTFGALALDFGIFSYLYPGGQCIDLVPGGSAAFCGVGSGANALINGNVMKKDVSYFEVFGKATYTFTDYFAVGGTVFYSPDFLQFGFDSTYASVSAKFTAPSSMLAPDVGAYLSGEYGHQWLGTTDAFYLNTPLPDYSTWNVGVGFTYKVFTLDLRYTDTDLSKAECNAITSDFGATANPTTGVFESKWCGASFIAKLSADVTLGQLK